MKVGYFDVMCCPCCGGGQTPCPEGAPGCCVQVPYGAAFAFAEVSAPPTVLVYHRGELEEAPA